MPLRDCLGSVTPNNLSEACQGIVFRMLKRKLNISSCSQAAAWRRLSMSSCSRAAAWRCTSPSHLEIGLWNNFSFRPWIGLIWEISAHEPVHSAWNFGARLFWKNQKITFPIFLVFPGCGEIGKSCFQYFQDGTESKKSVFQYFQDSGESYRLRFPIFPGGQ